MRILLIRHGDPDYVNDTLTEKGRREAALLAKRAVSMNMGECYKSPLGRAKDTATPCLEVTGKTAEILDWLQEFPAQVDLNKNPELEKAYPDVKKEGEHFLPRIAWDMVPGYWTEHEAYMDKNNRFRLNDAGLLVYSHGEYLAGGRKVGTFGYSVKKKQQKKQMQKKLDKKSDRESEMAGMAEKLKTSGKAGMSGKLKMSGKPGMSGKLKMSGKPEMSGKLKTSGKAGREKR